MEFDDDSDAATALAPIDPTEEEWEAAAQMGFEAMAEMDAEAEMQPSSTQQSGITGTFIKTLVKLVNAKDSHAEDGDAGSEASGAASKKTKKKGAPVRQLMRPIICICNDQYAPVLRPLREIAQVYVFRPPPYQVLAKRLHEVCTWEGFRADLRAMMALCEMTQGDMRSSINTLQFLHNRTDHLTKEILVSVDVGCKDISKSLFSVWQSLFVTPFGREAKQVAFYASDETGIHRGNAASDSKQGEGDRYLERLIPLLQNTGDYDKIMQGCFENYLKSQKFDAIISRTKSGSRLEQISRSTHFFDLLESNITKHQRFDLMSYQPYALVDFYRLFAVQGGSQPLELEFPRADYQSFVVRKETEGILNGLANGLGPMNPSAVVQGLNGLRLEWVPMLIRIISPDFRPHNVQLIKPEERAVLNRLVAIMSAFGMSLVSHRDSSERQILELDPPLHKLCLPLSDRERNINDLSSNIKQLIAHEPARDFFGRVIQSGPVESKPSDLSGKENDRANIKIAFKFNEGFSNAVRTPVYVKDFL
eukprot:jgi/Hompol1/6799/HPOL_001203-RA